jgi:hypothetical protein
MPLHYSPRVLWRGDQQRRKRRIDSAVASLVIALSTSGCYKASGGPYGALDHTRCTVTTASLASPANAEFYRLIGARLGEVRIMDDSGSCQVCEFHELIRNRQRVVAKVEDAALGVPCPTGE